MPTNPLLDPRWHLLTLEPTGDGIGWTSTLDGPPPEDPFAGRACISWAVRCHEETKIQLVAGPPLKELHGSVSIYVGDATPVGKRPSNDGTPRWGAVVLNNISKADKAAPASRFFVELHVSSQLFERIRSALPSGFVPRLGILIPQAVSPDVEPIHYRDQYVGDALVWENVNHPAVPIDWCTFEYTVAGRGADDAPTTLPSAHRPPTQRDLLCLLRALESAGESSQRRARQFARLGWLVVGLLAVIVVLLLLG